MKNRIEKEVDVRRLESNGHEYYYVANIRDMVQKRLERLYNSGTLRLEEFENKIFLCLLGDKGAATTKLTLNIGNVSRPNSFSNHLLIAIYDGNDKNADLQVLQNVIKQVEAIKMVQINDRQLSVEL